MQDAYGRTIRYLRISVTDRCNYCCMYCKGADEARGHRSGELLSKEEIAGIVSCASKCGIDKIRLTGGEPLVRSDIADICSLIRRVPGVRELTLTTNGSMLKEKAGKLKEAGVDRLNISIDTLDPDRFRSITRMGNLNDVLEGISAAEAAGFQNLKLNVVLIGGFNDDEIPDFVRLTKDRPVSVRFIELMPIGIAAKWGKDRFVSSEAVLEAVPELKEVETDGVASIFRVPGYAGSVGLIRPITGKFCDRCDRIRLTSDGKLKPCLHSPVEIPLKGLTGEELEKAFCEAIFGKPKEHMVDSLHPSESGRGMFEIGG